jgi:hypothetical protein
MNSHEVQMCVADCLRDDAVESLELILQALNDGGSASWRTARGCAFGVDEVRAALLALIAAKFVTACAEKAPTYQLQDVPGDEVGVVTPWESLWFHLEPAGHEAVKGWWEDEGQHRYPRP